jgi:hypothetical protein
MAVPILPSVMEALFSEFVYVHTLDKAQDKEESACSHSLFLASLQAPHVASSQTAAGGRPSCLLSPTWDTDQSHTQAASWGSLASRLGVFGLQFEST